jgi:hypothetical protein
MECVALATTLSFIKEGFFVWIFTYDEFAFNTSFMARIIYRKSYK